MKLIQFLLFVIAGAVLFLAAPPLGIAFIACAFLICIFIGVKRLLARGTRGVGWLYKVSAAPAVRQAANVRTFRPKADAPARAAELRKFPGWNAPKAEGK